MYEVNCGIVCKFKHGQIFVELFCRCNILTNNCKWSVYFYFQSILLFCNCLCDNAHTSLLYTSLGHTCSGAHDIIVQHFLNYATDATTLLRGKFICHLPTATPASQPPPAPNLGLRTQQWWRQFSPGSASLTSSVWWQNVWGEGQFFHVNTSHPCNQPRHLRWLFPHRPAGSRGGNRARMSSPCCHYSNGDTHMGDKRDVKQL